MTQVFRPRSNCRADARAGQHRQFPSPTGHGAKQPGFLAAAGQQPIYPDAQSDGSLLAPQWRNRAPPDPQRIESAPAKMTTKRIGQPEFAQPAHDECFIFTGKHIEGIVDLGEQELIIGEHGRIFADLHSRVVRVDGQVKNRGKIDIEIKLMKCLRC